jgi:hypothetical protein
MVWVRGLSTSGKQDDLNAYIEKKPPLIIDMSIHRIHDPPNRVSGIQRDTIVDVNK